MKLNRKIIIVGAGGSGKDYLKNALCERYGLKPSVGYTTRPMRPGDINGIDYHFVSDDEFNKMIESDEFMQWQEFNGWKYGTSKSDYLDSDVLIMNVDGLDLLGDATRKECFVVYVDIEEDVRRHRLHSRKDADIVERRIMSDREQFTNFDDYDYRISNPQFNVDKYIFGALRISAHLYNALVSMRVDARRRKIRESGSITDSDSLTSS